VDKAVFRVEADAESFRVLGPDDRVILQCRDAASAGHYADLLERAFRAGYRRGFRDARAASRPEERD